MSGKSGPIGHYFDGQYTRPFYRFTWEVLAASLGVFIEVETIECEDDYSLIPGSSKLCGLPHLPDETLFPVGYYFLAQINLAEVYASDHDNLLPSAGLISFFVKPSELECVVLFITKEMHRMQVCPYPDAPIPDESHYLRRFKDGAERMHFSRKFVFNINGLSFSIPREMTAELQAILGCRMADEVSPTSMFAKPFYYQGEIDNYRPVAIINDVSTETQELLLFQTTFADGHLHFWIKPNDLARQHFEDVFVTYSGT